MTKKLFAVCDLDGSYAERLTDYLNETQSRMFEVRAFSSAESLLSYGEGHHISLLLISTAAMSDAVRGLDAERIVILSEGEQVREWEQEKHVYKYQSSDQLVAEVLDCYASGAPGEPREKNRITCALAGVYSPVGRAGKTSFALTLSEILGRSRRVLYINLEDHSGFETIIGSGSGQDLSDLIYFARQKEGDLGVRLQSVVRSAGSIDYIPPAFSPSDLRDVPAEEWLELLARLCACTDYEVMVLDVGDRIDEFPLLLRECRRVYMPVLNDRASAAKIRQFEKNLEALDYGDVLAKLQKIRLPRTQIQGSGGRLLENLASGRLGEFTKGVIREDKEWEVPDDRKTSARRTAGSA